MSLQVLNISCSLTSLCFIFKFLKNLVNLFQLKYKKQKMLAHIYSALFIQKNNLSIGNFIFFLNINLKKWWFPIYP